jgi:hypothetical protein
MTIEKSKRHSDFFGVRAHSSYLSSNASKKFTRDWHQYPCAVGRATISSQSRSVTQAAKSG